MPFLTKNMTALKESAELLKQAGYIEIIEGNHLLYIQECSDGFDGSVYLKKDYMRDNDIDCIDGGIFEEDSALDAIKFFIKMSQDLAKGGG